MKRLLVALVLGVCAVASAQPVPSGGLHKVNHDATLTGAGTLASALGLAPCGSAGQTWVWNGSTFACGSAGGTVTNVDTLAPLQGGPITTTGTVSLTDCAANQIYKENGTGTLWGCAADSDTTYTAGAGLTLSGGAFLFDSSYSPTFAGLTDNGQLVTPGVITVTDTGTQNDYNPTGFSNASVVLFNNASTLNVTGFAGGTNGRRLTTCIISSSLVNFSNESGGSIAANRENLLTGAASQLIGGGANKIACIDWIYLGGSINRWVQRSQNTQVDYTAYTHNGTHTFNGGINTQGVVTLTSNAHMRCSNVISAPTSCGTGATIAGCDSFFTVTTGTGATGCVVSFGTAYSGTLPACIVTPYGGAALPSMSKSISALTFGTGTTASTTYDVHCSGTN